jgi:methionine-rich copper-binding protein CopC/chitodextrinase
MHLTKRDTRKTFILPLSLLLIFAFGLTVLPVGATDEPIANESMDVVPQTGAVHFNETFTVDIVINAPNVTTAQCYLTFDETLLTALSVENGDIFDSLNDNGTINNAEGKIDNIFAWKIPPAVPGGVFATITFRAKEMVGTAAIEFSEEDCFVPPYTLAFNDAQVEVRNYPVMVNMSPQSQLIGNETGYVDVMVDTNGNTLTIFTCNITYDATLFDATISAGTLFDTVTTAENTPGTIEVFALEPLPGVNGSGTLLTLELMPVQTGTSALAVPAYDIVSDMGVHLYADITGAEIEADITPPAVAFTEISPQFVNGGTYLATQLMVNFTASDDHIWEVMLIVYDNATGQMVYGKFYEYENYTGTPPTAYAETWSYVFNLTNGTAWEQHLTVMHRIGESGDHLMFFGYFNETGDAPNIPVAIFVDPDTYEMTAIHRMDGSPGGVTIIYGTSTFLPTNTFIPTGEGDPAQVNGTTTFVVTENITLVPVTPADAAYGVMARATDTLDNEGFDDLVGILDNTPPTTTSDLAGPMGNQGWYTGPVSINLTAADAGSGVMYIQYRFGHGAWMTYNGTIELTADGLHNLSYSAADNLGNKETASTLLIYVDTTPPSIMPILTPAAPDGQHGWYVSPVTVELNATDATSGINYTMYRIDGGNWTAYNLPFIVTADGTHLLEYYTVDMAGHVTAGNVTFSIDRTPPTVYHGLTPATPDGANGWYVGPVTVTLFAGDAPSGVNHTMYRIDGSAWTEYTAPFAVTADGTHLVEYYTVDMAGHVTAGNVTFGIDTTAPLLVYTLGGTLGNGGWYRTQVTVTFEPTDATSDIDTRRYQIDGGAWQNYTTPFTVGNGIHTVYLKATDAAGNDNTTTAIAIKVDTISPTATVAGVANGQTYTEPKTVTLSASDNAGGSGVAELKYQLDDGNLATYNQPFSVATDGQHTVKYYAVDSAGNTGTQTTVTFVIELNKKPVAAFTYSDNPNDVDNTKFDASDSYDQDEGGTIVNYTWNFGDGSTAFGKVVYHLFDDNGTYTVTLTVTDDFGATDSVTEQVVVANVAPTALFTYDPDKPKFEGGEAEVTFTDLSEDDDGTIESWLWDFGDGETSTEQNPVHTYADDKTYTVTLTVTDDDGETATTELDIKVVKEQADTMLYLAIIVALIIVAVIVVVVWRQRNKGV